MEGSNILAASRKRFIRAKQVSDAGVGVTIGERIAAATSA
jgi:hypothetical protein